MWHHCIKTFSFLVVLAALFSCANRHIEEGVVRLPKKKEKDLINALEQLSTLRPSTFYTKIKCNYSDTTKNVNFKTSIRLVKDSAINPLITYANIPIVSAIIRPDSIIITNKREKCFVKQDLSFFREAFGIDFSYQNIEELFLGLPLGFDTTQKYFEINDPYNYIISSKRKREIRRELRPNRTDRERQRENRLDRDNSEQEQVILKYYLNHDLQSVQRIHIDSPEDTASIDIQFISRDSIDSYLIPNEVHIEIVTPRNHIVMDMNYDKSEVNKPQEIYFVIPEDYEACESEK